ncbi:zinc-binding metallopeptidase family protein [Rivibacter subsaxonicus]|nr:putative zinc-binding metallopeptidase [Rivibacter subsaxonicus]
MQRLFDSLTQQLGTAWKPTVLRPRRGHAYRCRCGRPVFFRNSLCLACHTELGFDPERGTLLPLVPGPFVSTWMEAAAATNGASADVPLYTRCANYDSAAGCNWLLPLAAPAAGRSPQLLCRACRLNRMIPNQAEEAGREAWAKIELAKRRLVAQLLALGLPVASKLSEDPQRGIAFDFLADQPGARVMTGHGGGIITLNIEEADDAVRERNRAELHEPYRTLLGHLRHEVGHYYWDRLVDGTPWLESFRTLFGDERASYSEALRRNYEQGPPHDWVDHYISGYASSHPWEDWAETWSHYLHITDTLETALGFGLDASDVELESEPFGADALETAFDPEATKFLAFISAWVELSALLNELSRSMGQPDLCPFVLSRTVVRKLHFVHRVVRGQGAG